MLIIEKLCFYQPKKEIMQKCEFSMHVFKVIHACVIKNIHAIVLLKINTGLCSATFTCA